MAMNVSLRKSLRNRLRNRDGNLCHYCDVEMTEPTGHRAEPQTCTLEHVVPRSYGGSDDPSNLVLACSDCNGARGNDLDFCWCARCKAVMDRWFNKRFYSLINANKARVHFSKGMWRVRINKKTNTFSTWQDAMTFALTGDKNA